MDPVDAAFRAVPRTGFLRLRDRFRASYDGPLAIGHGATCSQPRTVAQMLRLLDVGPGMAVLDVGAGSGWTTALLAELTGPAGLVVGVEIEPQLAEWGAANLARTGHRWASIVAAAPGVLGLPAAAPYDRILVSADAPDLPAALLGQLADPGRMVLPVRGRMTLVVRAGADPVVTEHGSYRFVPLL
jgi:protein-L-isoaspartate(D-aspartate) O-methyltransferase